MGDVSNVFSQNFLGCLYLTRIFCGQATNLYVRLQNGEEHATNVRRLISHIQFTSEYKQFVMWETLPKSTSEVVRLFQEAGCARNRHVSHTVQQTRDAGLHAFKFKSETEKDKSPR